MENNGPLTINKNTIGVWYIHLKDEADWVCVANAEEGGVILFFRIQIGSADRVSILGDREALNSVSVPSAEAAISTARQTCRALAEEDGLLWWELLGRPGEPDNREKIIEELKYQDWYTAIT